MRTLTRQARDLLESRIHALIVAQAQSFDVSAEIEYRRVYPVLVDWPEPTRFGGEMALALVGAERCNVSAAASTASDDIAFLLEKVPGRYVIIGNGNGDGSCMVHNPGYDFNDENLTV
jgi:hippurate hydrolase